MGATCALQLAQVSYPLITAFTQKEEVFMPKFLLFEKPVAEQSGSLANSMICLCMHPTSWCLQNTKVQGAISHLFEGHTFNFVECINVDYKSTRKESYMDLQLDVKGCKNVYDSFVKYTEVEKLDGQNQYKAEGHGLQVTLPSFTPALMQSSVACMSSLNVMRAA